MTFELFRIMSLVSSDEISLLFILGMVGNVLVTLIPMAVPISIYFSTIFSLNRMSGDSEYVAMRAGGLDKKNILLDSGDHDGGLSLFFKSTISSRFT